MKESYKQMEKSMITLVLLATFMFLTSQFIIGIYGGITGLAVSELEEDLEYVKTCYDGVMNNRETNIDCGGPCKPCCMPDVNIFGPVNAKSNGNVYDYDFEAIPGKYLLHIGNNYGAKAWVELNGEYVLTPDYVIDKVVNYEVNVKEANKMIIRMDSDTGSSLIIWISKLCDCDTDLLCPETFVCDGWCVPKESCDDGMMNQDEDRIDCGGQCEPCVEMPGVVRSVWLQNLARFIRYIGIILVYALIIVIVLAGAVYISRSYQQRTMYKDYVDYRKRRKEELKGRAVEREKQLIVVQSEKTRTAFEKAKQEYIRVLDGFIQNAASSGKTKTQIKEELLKQGWPKKFVESYCDKFFEIHEEIITAKREEIREVKRRELLERKLDYVIEEIKETKEYIEEELPKKWAKPGKGVKIKKRKIEYEPEKVSKEELARLSEQIDEIDQEIEKSPEYIKEELSKKWTKPGKGVELVKRELRFKKQKISEKNIELLEKQLLTVGEKIKQNLDYIKEELPGKWARPGKGVELDKKRIKFKEKYFSAENYENLLNWLKYQKDKLVNVNKGIDKNEDYIDEESKFKYEPVKKELKFKKQEVSKEELAKLAEQMSEIDKKIETSEEYLRKELPRKWDKLVLIKPIELVKRKVKFEKEEVSEEEISKLQKHLGKIDEELEKLGGKKNE